MAPPITRDDDRDGVPNPLDRCPGTPRGTTVDARGCPAAAQPAPATQPVAARAAPAPAGPAQPSLGAQQPSGAVQPQAQPAVGQAGAQPRPAPGQTAVPTAGQPTAPAAGQPQTAAPTPQRAAAPGAGQQAAAPVTGPPAQPAAGQPAQPGAARQPTTGPAGAGAVTGAAGAAAPAGQPARGAAPAAPQPAGAIPTPPISLPSAPATAPTITAGFWVPAYSGRSHTDVLEYARTAVIRLDSTIVALVEVFRNTSGVPVAGATGPSLISSRERARWERCRLIYYDLLTFTDAATFLKDSLTSTPTLARATSSLDGALQELQAPAECDNVVSMIEAPDRWSPWQQNYENSARGFYRDWYTQLRAVHEADRNLARLLNTALPAARQFPIPPGLPPNPPTIGSAR